MEGTRPRDGGGAGRAGGVRDLGVRKGRIVSYKTSDLPLQRVAPPPTARSSFSAHIHRSVWKIGVLGTLAYAGFQTKLPGQE